MLEIHEFDLLWIGCKQVVRQIHNKSEMGGRAKQRDGLRHGKVLETNVDVKCIGKLVTVELISEHLPRSTCRDKKQTSRLRFELETRLFLEIHHTCTRISK